MLGPTHGRFGDDGYDVTANDAIQCRDARYQWSVVRVTMMTSL